jgi:polyphosphate kinase
VPKLQQAGIRFQYYQDLQPQQRDFLRWYFEREVLVLPPPAFDPALASAYVNLSFNLAVVVNDPQRGDAAKGSQDVLPRLVRIPDETGTAIQEGANRYWAYLCLDGRIIAAHLDMLFPGLAVVAISVSRDARC